MHLKIIMPVVLLLLLGSGSSHAAFAGTVEIQSLQILPVETIAGKHLEITGTIKADSAKAPGEIMEINVIASLALPDHTVKSWTWQKIRIKAGETMDFSKESEVKLAGVYKVDFSVYSKDMWPLKKLSKSVTLADPSHSLVKTAPTDTSHPLVKTPPQAGVKGSAGVSSVKAPSRPAEDQDQRIGVGVYVNTVNTAGGATILYWPLTYVGLQGSYTMGMFTTAEVRLLGRLPLSEGINPYAGVGYASVTTERTVDVIGIKTTFSDSGVSGVIGVEIPLSRSVFGYVEISGAALDLKKEMINGGLTGIATVKYSPVTVGFSIVYFVF